MTGTSKRRGRPPIYDPATVRRLLAERDRSGESYAELSLRSGIPAGTLAAGSRKRSRLGRPAFVELVHTGEAPSEPVSASMVTVELEDCAARVQVPTDIKADQLREIILALRGPRC